MAKHHAPASLAALPAAAALGHASRRAKRAAGLAWARAWRERNRPLFDAMEAAGAFLPKELGA